MMIALQNTPEHLERRKPWQRAVTPSAVKGYEPVIVARIHQLIRALEEQQGEVRLDSWIKCLTYVLPKVH